MKKIQEIKNFQDVCSYLKISEEDLKTLSFNKDGSIYTKAYITKRNGNKRNIYIPVDNLNDVQKKIKELIENEFNPSKYATAYKKDSSIIKNATPHTKKEYVIHLDIKNFFSSINFARVRNMFIRYFKANPAVATILANLCCVHDGDNFFLPQGACTSAVISNVIAKTMDRQIIRYLKEVKLLNWNYTRYADDITISTNNNYFEKIELISKIKEYIKKNGFEVNESKTRVEKSTVRQSVTGIIVNDGVNVSKKYRKNIKSFLHGFENAYKNKVDIEEIYQKFWDSYKKRNKKYNVESMTPFDILRGMINFVGDVKGRGNEEFIFMVKKFNKLIKLFNIHEKEISYQPIQVDLLQENTFVVEMENEYDEMMYKRDYIFYGQGTGFILKNHGFVTNYHVLQDVLDNISDIENIWYKTEASDRGRIVQAQKEEDIIFKAHNPITGVRLSMNVKRYNKKEDWALLNIINFNDDTAGLEAIKNNLTNGMKITCYGYPEYSEDNYISIQSGNLGNPHNGLWTVDGIRIIQGNSGGPVVNKNNQVVGIASKGENSESSVQSQIVPIEKMIQGVTKCS